MKFAIAASDRYIGVFEAWIAAGWEPHKLYTSGVDGVLHRNDAIMRMANRLGIGIEQRPINLGELHALASAGCDTLVIAGYSWRIPEWQGYLRYACNFHPSPLPEGRGPYPIIPALLRGVKHWGVSCHRIDGGFDTGPLIATERFAVPDHATHDDLDLRCQMAMRQLAERVAANLEKLWDRAIAQTAGTYDPHWNAQQRRLNFSQPIETVMRVVRAFGLIETTAVINGVEIFVRRAAGWHEPHSWTPGSLVHRNAEHLVIAVLDGFIAILEWSLIGPDISAGNIHR